MREDDKLFFIKKQIFFFWNMFPNRTDPLHPTTTTTFAQQPPTHSVPQRFYFFSFSTQDFMCSVQFVHCWNIDTVANDLLLGPKRCLFLSMSFILDLLTTSLPVATTGMYITLTCRRIFQVGFPLFVLFQLYSTLFLFIIGSSK